MDRARLGQPGGLEPREPPPRALPGVANLCVPYFAAGFAPANMIPLVDRTIYPEAEFPAASGTTCCSTRRTSRARGPRSRQRGRHGQRAVPQGQPGRQGQPSRLAGVRRDNGWFGGAGAPGGAARPRRDHRGGSADLCGGAERSGFFGPDSWYMNAPPTSPMRRAQQGGRLAMPVLFLHGARRDLRDPRVAPAEPMRDCADLTEAVVPSGHWMAQEKPRRSTPHWRGGWRRSCPRCGGVTAQQVSG